MVIAHDPTETSKIRNSRSYLATQQVQGQPSLCENLFPINQLINQLINKSITFENTPHVLVLPLSSLFCQLSQGCSVAFSSHSIWGNPCFLAFCVLFKVHPKQNTLEEPRREAGHAMSDNCKVYKAPHTLTVLKLRGGGHSTSSSDELIQYFLPTHKTGVYYSGLSEWQPFFGTLTFVYLFNFFTLKLLCMCHPDWI